MLRQAVRAPPTPPLPTAGTRASRSAPDPARARSYTQKRFKRHFGKVRSELQKVKEALAAPKPDATAAAPVKGAAAPAPRRTPSRRSLLRVGAAARLSSASFAEPGLLGIEWAAEAVLRPPDHVAEVLGELRAAADAAGAKPRGADNTAIASRGDLHPKAVVAGKRADAVPPPKGFAAFEPSPTFEGARDGYQFQLGSMGVGYYWYGGEAGRRAIARAKAQRADDSSESDEEDDDEVEYGCVIRGLRPDSMAAAAAAAGQGAALRVGMALKQVNAWPTDGQETDEIIEYIASQSRSPEHPLVLRFAPSASADSGKKEVKGKQAGAEESAAPPAKRRRTLKWADDAGGSTLEEMEPPALDMFGGAEASASSGKERQAPGDGREIGGQVLGPGVKAVPFHLRAAAEMAKFTAVQDAAKAKKARLETVRTIASRQEQQRQEMAAAAERQREVRDPCLSVGWSARGRCSRLQPRRRREWRTRPRRRSWRRRRPGRRSGA